MNEDKDRSSIGALFIPAGLMIGLGVGFITDNLAAGLFIGLGGGFLFFAFASFAEKQSFTKQH